MRISARYRETCGVWLHENIFYRTFQLKVHTLKYQVTNNQQTDHDPKFILKRVGYKMR